MLVTPNLQFMPFSTAEGFSSKSVAGDDDAHPGPIVRELIQNALDAGRRANRLLVEVRFSFDTIATDDLPDFKTYQAAYQAAIKEHEKAHENIEALTERILASTTAPTVDVLYVSDNGIGLDSDTMNALLGNGLTSKSGDQADSVGSYGLGHFTPFPASDLQYILYAGISKDGCRIAAGHAILAAHRNSDDGKLRGKDGYFITGTNDEVYKRFQFAANGQIPPLLDAQLDELEAAHESGSIIAITAFNCFRENPEKNRHFSINWIMGAAARHFFPAIYEGRLQVELVQDDEIHTLDRNMLQGFLEKIREERKSQDVLNGAKAYAAYLTLLNGRKETIETPSGPCTLILRTAPDERTRVSLFRSGMFITDDLPRNQATTFSNYRNFNAVLLVEPEATDVFRLIRNAEGEKHIDIKRQRLSKEDRAGFDDFFLAVQKNIKELAEEDDSDTFTPDHFMPLEVRHLREPPHPHNSPATSHKGQGWSQPNVTPVQEGLAESIYEDAGGGPYGDEANGGSNTGSGDATGDGKAATGGQQDGSRPTFDRRGTSLAVKSVARRTNEEILLTVVPSRTVANAGIRIAMDRGTDATCPSPLSDEFLAMVPGAMVDGQPLADEAHIRSDLDGEVYELLLGPLVEGQRRHVRVQLRTTLPDLAAVKISLVAREANAGGPP